MNVVSREVDVCEKPAEVGYANKLAAGFTLQHRIDEMRKEAAKRGANVLLVKTRPVLIFGDVNVEGWMYRC